MLSLGALRRFACRALRVLKTHAWRDAVAVLLPAADVNQSN
jgi:hypothetical protein